MINPYIKNDIDSEQYKWLVNDLEHVNKKVTPWTIVVTHGPWYNSNNGHPTDIEEQGNQKRATEDLLYKHQIPLVVSGHVHSYERTYRVYKEKKDPNGPMYLNVGDGGNHEGARPSGGVRGLGGDRGLLAQVQRGICLACR